MNNEDKGILNINYDNIHFDEIQVRSLFTSRENARRFSVRSNTITFILTDKFSLNNNLVQKNVLKLFLCHPLKTKRISLQSYINYS